MAIARTYPTLRTRPSLRTRIVERQQGPTTIPAGRSGIRKPVTTSFAERYRGTEFETHTERTVVSEPLLSRARTALLVSGAAVAVVVGVMLGAGPV